MANISPITFETKNSSIVTVRSLVPGDEEASRALALIVASETKNTLKYQGMPLISPEKLTDVFMDYLNHPVDIYIGAFVGDEIIGSLRFFQRNNSHPWIKHVGAFGMSVRESYWGQGIGSRMLQIMTSHARTTEIMRIEAEVRASNDRGINLYQKNGFKIEGRREKAAFIDGTYEDEFYIAKCF